MSEWEAKATCQECGWITDAKARTLITLQARLKRQLRRHARTDHPELKPS